MIPPEFLHYLSITLAIGLGTIGTSLGQGLGAAKVFQSLARQELGSDTVFRAMVIGLAFLESGVILALVICLITLFSSAIPINYSIAIAEMGVALAIGVSATIVSIASSFAVRQASQAISRQPIFAPKILTLMLLAQVIMEAPVIFAFIISLLIRHNFVQDMSIFIGYKLFFAGLTIALGSIGPSIGQARFARSFCTAIGNNRHAYNRIFPFAIINQAVIETPLLFCLLTSIMIIFINLSGNLLGSIISFGSASLLIPIASLVVAMSTGKVASNSCDQIAAAPENFPILFRTTLVAQVFIESAAIYALIITLVLLTRSW